MTDTYQPALEASKADCEECAKEMIKTDGVGIREKEIWNAAIEAATLRAKENGAHPNVLLKVMRLKK